MPGGAAPRADTKSDGAIGSREEIDQAFKWFATTDYPQFARQLGATLETQTHYALLQERARDAVGYAPVELTDVLTLLAQVSGRADLVEVLLRAELDKVIPAWRELYRQPPPTG